MRLSPHAPVLVVMGVSGSGKTTIGKMLADRFGWAFEEGDLLHPEANVAKMHAGIPLTDKDREPWLEAVRLWIDKQREQGKPGIIACSALKRAYRDFLRQNRNEVHLIYLRGSRELIAQRLARRRGHFMPAKLLESQFAALQEPKDDEVAIIAGDALPPGAIVDEIISQLLSKGLIASAHINRESSGKTDGGN